MMKLLAALTAATLVAAPSPPIPAEHADSSPFFVNLGLVHEITCASLDGTVSGSGSYIDGDTILTAWHVMARGGCIMSGQPLEATYHDAALDIAVAKTPIHSELRMPISCAVPREGDEFFAVGYPFGSVFVVQRFTGTGNIEKRGTFKGMAEFRGHGYPGMSGGPVVDRDGNLVGVLNAGNAAGSMLSRLARDTYLCAGRLA